MEHFVAQGSTSVNEFQFLLFLKYELLVFLYVFFSIVTYSVLNCYCVVLQYVMYHQKTKQRRSKSTNQNSPRINPSGYNDQLRLRYRVAWITVLAVLGRNRCFRRVRAFGGFPRRRWRFEAKVIPVFTGPLVRRGIIGKRIRARTLV